MAIGSLFRSTFRFRRLWLPAALGLAVLIGLVAVAGTPPPSTPLLGTLRGTFQGDSALVTDPAAGPVTGRIQRSPGKGQVLMFEGNTAGRPLTHDATTFWTLALELPTSALASPGPITLGTAPAVVRIASEDVVYQSVTARGRLILSDVAPDRVAGHLEVRFIQPMRDHLKQGDLVVDHPFEARRVGAP